MPNRPDHLKMTPFYGFFHYLAGQIHAMWFRGEVVGTENFPRVGPFLIASNHASHLDPPLVGSQIAKQMRFFARKSLWHSRFLGWWLDQVETIPVERDTGDIGSVIFPDADFRFFLHADPAERAKRRAMEGQTDSIAERDRIDSSRKASPLTCPVGAIDIDSTTLTLDQVVEKMAALIAEKVR